MIKIKNISVILLLLLFAVALVQCSKEVASKEDKDIQFELRNPTQLACEPLAGSNPDTINEIQGGIYLPTYPGCELKGQFLYLQDGLRFAFTDFILMIPETPGCEGLLAYLNGLSPVDYRNEMKLIALFVEAEGQRLILQAYSDENPSMQISNIKTFKSLCRQQCKWNDMDCIKHEVDQPIRERSIELRNGGNGGDKTSCWKSGWFSCGHGCCVTTANYSRVNGKLVLTSASTQAFGPCNGGPEQKWPRFVGKCPAGSIILDPCTLDCPN